MIKKTLLLLLTVIMTLMTASAATINEGQARDIASKFLASRLGQATTPRIATRGPQLQAPKAGNDAAYYVFNANATSGGYVIIAGDDRAPAVLGYSDKGTFDTQAIPEGLQYLLEGYAAQIEALDQGAVMASREISGPAIRPLVPAVWSQNNPFNILLPFRPDGKHAVAGCVATAMAQLMYYWQWPVRPSKTIPAYTSETLSIYMPALPPVDFDWDAMRDTYLTDDTTSTEALAAATLTLYCAQSVEMDFKASSSSATTTRVPMMLANYFDFKSSGHCISRENYTSQGWAEALYSELAEGRPIIFSASKKSGGHAFICDGYDGNGMFHFNWGWNGQSNGYFLLNVINPDAQGTGSASGTYGYILRQAALVGLEPGNEGISEFVLTATDVALNSTTTSRTGTNYDFRATVTGRFRNYTSEIMAVSFGWGLYQGETLKSVLYSANGSSLQPGYYYTLSEKVLSFGSGITSGTYRIVPIYSEYSANNWRPCAGADQNYIEVTISGNTCTYTGHGTAAERDYTINDITFTGSMHTSRPIDINVNMTNNGESCNNILYLFENGTFIAAAYVGLNKGETGDIGFRYMPATAGQRTLTWSWDEDGNDPIATRTVTIEAMPAATMSATMNVLNVTDSNNRIITSDKFSVDVTFTNNGNAPYHEDISVSLFKHLYANYGTRVQSINRLIDLAPGESITMHFDLDQVMDNWKFYVRAYCYSADTQVSIASSGFYTIIFPEEPQLILGDMNGDGELTIADVTILISHVLNGHDDPSLIERGDMSGDGELTIADVTRLISKVLS